MLHISNHSLKSVILLIEILVENPLLLLFVVASIGYLIGNVKIKGISLGVAAILFTGLVFGALDTRLSIPKVIFSLGLILFVYSIGLSSGTAFFQSYKKNGLRDFFFILIMLVVSGCIAFLLALAFGFSAASITGIYAGSTTNTPALAGVLDFVQNSYDSSISDPLSNDLVVGYSFSYPMGVLGGIIGILIMEQWLKIDYKAEKETLKKEYPIGEQLTSTTLKVQNEEVLDIALRDLRNKYKWDVVFGRVKKDKKVMLSNYDMELELGDTIMVVGSEEEIARVEKVVGERTKNKLSYDRNKYDVRRIFVSNRNVVGRSLASLDIQKNYNAIVTRIRRGDIEMLAKSGTVLEQGDRIRFVARRSDLKSLARFFGDSYTASSKVNLFSFGLGIGLGLLVGMFKIQFTDTFSFQLGNAGGPLIVGLFLGAVRRTGPVVWALPYSANVTLQQIGLILLLASVGVSSGNTFIESLNSEAIYFILVSGIISILTALFTLYVGYKIVKIPFSILMGIVSNQPAILDFALSRSDSSLPSFGYTMVFPIALIGKIIIAQILFVVMQSL